MFPAADLLAIQASSGAITLTAKRPTYSLSAAGGGDLRVLNEKRRSIELHRHAEGVAHNERPLHRVILRVYKCELDLLTICACLAG